VTHSSLNRRRIRFIPLAFALCAVFLATYAAPTAQEPALQAPPSETSIKKVLTIEDYTKWKSISDQAISGDGQWVAYVLQSTNVPSTDTKPVLHLLNLATNQDVEVANATEHSFSSDSKWIAYQIAPPGVRGGRGGRGAAAAPGATPAQDEPTGRGAQAVPAVVRRTELRNLATGEVKSWQDIQSFTFSENATHLLLRRRAPEAAGGTGRAGGAATGGGGRGGNAATPEGPRGVDVTVYNLSTGKAQLLGSVGDAEFNKAGDLLAYTVDAAVKDSNGLFLIDLSTSRASALDNDAKSYNRLEWNEDGTGLAVLKGADVDKMRERDNVLMVFPMVRSAFDESAAATPVILDQTTVADFPEDWVISDRTALEWSEDGKRVFFGIKEQVTEEPSPSARKSTDEEANVDVWNTVDERIQSVQMTRANADRNFAFQQAFDIEAKAFVKLADETLRDLDLAPDGRWAVGRDTRGFVSDYERPAADFYRVNTTTGERTLMFKGQLTGAGTLGISPDGKTFLYWKDNRFQAYDLDAGASTTLGGTRGPSFVDMEYDHPGPKPSYGIAGFTVDGKAAIVQQRYDLWLMPLDGSDARNLTNGFGTKNEVRFRYVRTAPPDPDAPSGGGGRGRGAGPGQTIDLSKPITLSAYGEYTKKAGFYELNGTALSELVYEDASFSTPLRAAKAEKLLFTRQTFTEFPDLRVSGLDLKASTKITNANPQQADYIWGHRVLFDFKDSQGHRLQGILALPDTYKAGEKLPMMVSFYEDNSQNLHRYSAPSYLTGMGSSPIQAISEGYMTMLPDIHYHTGSSHSDQLDAVEAAVKKVIEMGYADPKRIGINGHSYGGEGAAFIGTRSRLFAAVGMGAGVTDLYTDFSQSWGWSYQINGGSGANGNDYYMYGQGRWGFSPWEKPDVYRFESAITHVPEATAPFLIMHGTDDPTVSFAEGMNFYNALRFNDKSATLLAYPGEGHGLRGMANRKDLTVRFFEFFNHFLKDELPPKWLTDGVPFLKKGENKIIK